MQRWKWTELGNVCLIYLKKRRNGLPNRMEKEHACVKCGWESTTSLNSIFRI